MLIQRGKKANLLFGKQTKGKEEEKKKRGKRENLIQGHIEYETSLYEMHLTIRVSDYKNQKKKKNIEPRLFIKITNGFF